MQGSQILQARDHIGVVGAEHLLANRQRALVERFRLSIVALGFAERGQVVQARGHIGVVGAERLLPDGQRALEERLGLGVGALGVVEVGRASCRERVCLLV